ncbi:MAG: SDR family oxidoreductase [Firmicutes bacterium]|nr:SDR family oxidoreductase [Candidatus Caballimonas caccae]
MEEKLNGKVIVITGASSGIGNAIAKRLALSQATIVMFGGRNQEKLFSAKDEIIKQGGKCLAISGNLTDSNFIDNGIKKILNEYGKIDILINNAGSAFSSPFTSVTEKQFDEIMELDVKVPFFLTQKMLPYLKKSNYATIINIASIVGHLGYPLQSAYSMAKHALLGFTKSLANEVYKDGVRVHAISPGGVYTDMVKLTRPDLKPEDVILPEDVAESVAFLLNNRNSAVIDEIIIHRVGKAPFGV